MRRILDYVEAANGLILTGTAIYVIVTAIYGLISGQELVWVYFFGLGASQFPISLILAGLFLIGLVYRWGLFAFPLFLMTTNFFELIGTNDSFFAYLHPFQFLFMLFGFVMCSPRFKETRWLPLLCIALIADTHGPLFFHYIWIASLFAYVLFATDSVQSPWGNRRKCD